MASVMVFKIIPMSCIYGYITNNFYSKLKGKTSHNTVIDDGIVNLIHGYCLVPDIDALTLSNYTAPEQYVETKELPLFKTPTQSSNGTVINNIKSVVIGESCIGKTCLLMRYTTGTFPQPYVPTIADNHWHQLVVDGQQIELGLWDTAGGEDYPRLRPLCYPQTDIFLICVSVYDEKTFKLDKDEIFTDSQINTMAFCQEVQELCPNTPYVFIGTKSDLRSVQKGCYSKQEMETFSNYCKALGYAECSALADENVKEIFEFAVRKSVEFKKRLQKPTKKKSCILM
eukprot:155727_1